MTTDSTPRAAKPPAPASAPAEANSQPTTGPAAPASDESATEPPDEQAPQSPADEQPSVNGDGGPKRVARRLAALAAASLRDPLAVGTFAPSSQALADRLASVVPTPAQHPAPIVVELGAGTGEITPTIMRRVGPRARVLAVESDAKLAAILQRRKLGVEVLASDARKLPQLLAERDIDGVDAIVSAIPFTLMQVDGQRELLRAVHSCVRPDGVFTTVAYAAGLRLPGAVRFRKELTTMFDEVLPTRTIWRNFLPAMSYVCRYPKVIPAD